MTRNPLSNFELSLIDDLRNEQQEAHRSCSHFMGPGTATSDHAICHQLARQKARRAHLCGELIRLLLGL